MNAEKPLHVQVAEALGCHPMQGYGISDAWVCGCVSGEHSKSQPHPFILRYDTDWQATGPLIERFKIGLDPHSQHWEVWAIVECTERATGQTLLKAVCNLILQLHAAGKLR